MKSSEKTPIRAIALMSSGLDSLLAAKLIKDQGIDVRGVCFYFRFDNLADKIRSGKVDELVTPLDIPIQYIDVSEEYLLMWLDPPRGYGSGVNPCIDCHLFFLKQAAGMMESINAKFLITGEVVGQRPMSQNRPTLDHIEKVSELKGLILRPLSGKLFPPTLPEIEGWIDREKLLDISGRGRSRQLELAKQLGVEKFTPPAGGCVLTEPNFSRRAKALLDHRNKSEITIDALRLLRHGRQFWIDDHLYVIVGRDEPDNDALEEFRPGRWAFMAADTDKTPLVLAEGIRNDHDIETVARITARYCSGDKSNPRKIQYTSAEKEGKIDVLPAHDSLIESSRT